MLRERGMAVTEFADRISCHRKNVYDIFRRKSLDIDHLIRISEALDYDFIQECYYDREVVRELKFSLLLRDGRLIVSDREE